MSVAAFSEKLELPFWKAGAASLLVLVLALGFQAIGLFFVPMLLVIVVAGCYLFVLQPRWWLYCVAVSLPLFFGTSDEGVSAIDVILGVFLLGTLFVWLVHRVLIDKRVLFQNWFDILLLLYFLFVSLNLIVALSNGTTVLNWLRMFSLGAMVLYYFPFREHFSEPRYFYRMAILLAVCVAGVTMKSVLEYRSIVKASEYAFQIAGRRMVPHVFLMACIFSFLYAIHGRIHIRRILPIGFAFLFVVGLVTTYARTTWLAFLFSILVAQFFIVKKQRIRTLILLVSFAAVTSLAITVVFGRTSTLVSKVIARRFTSSSNVKKDQALGNRYYESKAVSRYIEKEPISGYGLATKYEGYDGYLVESSHRMYIHNGFLSSLYSYGIAGAIIQYAMFLTSIARAFLVTRRVRMPLARLLALASLLTLFGMFLENVTATVFFFRGAVFVLALCFACTAIAERMDNDWRRLQE